MTTLASSIDSLHKDIRSASRDYKRSKDSTTKWAIGTRPPPGVVVSLFDADSPLPPFTKVRPIKKYSEASAYNKMHTRSVAGPQGLASNRVARKNAAKAESAEPATLSRSLADLAPHNSPAKAARTPAVGDAGVLYSFDAASSPGKDVGLESLVEKAEREWSSRETARLVKNEYEILAEVEGEVTVVKEKEGKRGKKSPKSAPKLVVENDEDDWERI